MAFEVIMGEDCIFVVSTKVQSAFGTRLTDLVLEAGRRINLNTATMGDTSIIRAGGGPKPGSRTEHCVAANERIVGHDSRLSLAMDCDSFMVGWALSHIFQDVTSTQEGTTGHYEHVMICSDPLAAGVGRSSEITSVYLDTGGPDATRLLRVLPDLAVASVTLSGRGKDIVSLAVELPGSGLEVYAAVDVTPPAYASVIALFANDGFKLEYGDRGGALVDISERLDEWSLRFNKVLALDQGYYPGSGYYRKRLWFLRRTFSIELALFADRASRDLIDDMVDQTRKEVQITIDSGILAGAAPSTSNHKFIARYPDVRITESPLNFRPEGAAYQVRVAEDQVFLDADDADSPCTVTLDNDIAAYLVPVA